MNADRPTAADRWVNRVLIAVIAAVALFTAWPTIKGIYYAHFPPPPLSADQLPAWRHDFDAALAESAQSGKPVLIDFTADWCPPCKVMDAEVWPDADVRAAIADRVIPLKLDLDAPATAGPQFRYGVESIPAVLIVDAAGAVLARGELMTADEMVHFIRDHAKTPPLGTAAAGD